MNPKRWKWYTWIILVFFPINLVANYSAPGDAVISVIVCVIYWFFLWLIHQIVRAFYLAFTGKMPPPATPLQN